MENQLLLDRMSRELTDKLKVKVIVMAVSGADHFYTDGASVGATYRIVLPDSSMNYVRQDGTVVFTMSDLWQTYGDIIRQYMAA